MGYSSSLEAEAAPQKGPEEDPSVSDVEPQE
jgi:hypothetical protein